jgi:hypothetical protein
MTDHAAPRGTCRSHCAACDRHFAGDHAFDLHRRGKPDRRYCVDPVNEPRLVIASDDAYCRISGAHNNRGPITLDPVIVYALARNYTPAERARLDNLKLPAATVRAST